MNDLNYYFDQERQHLQRLYDDYLKNYGVSDLKIISDIDQESVFDAIAFSANTKILIEHKIRSCSTDRYSSSLIEQSKFFRLQEYAERYNVPVWYVNVFTDYVLIFQLDFSTLPPSGTTRADRKTFVDIGKKLKDVFYLDYSNDVVPNLVAILRTDTYEPVSFERFKTEREKRLKELDDIVNRILNNNYDEQNEQ